MPMTDPMDALRSLQSAMDAGKISFEQCEIHKELSFHLDHPNGKPRFTYAIMKGRTVAAIAMFVLTDPVGSTHCFAIGYAVVNSERTKGLGSTVLSQAMDELRNGLSRTPMKEFYVDAVVSTTNVASNRMAHKLISSSPTEITDGPSGEQAFHYLRKVECGI